MSSADQRGDGPRTATAAPPSGSAADRDHGEESADDGTIKTLLAQLGDPTYRSAAAVRLSTHVDRATAKEGSFTGRSRSAMSRGSHAGRRSP
jgi:hypothetical protein